MKQPDFLDTGNEKDKAVVIFRSHGNTLVIKSLRTRKMASYFSRFGE